MKKILCLADLHLSDTLELDKRQWLSNLLIETSPDIILLAGDIIEGYSTIAYQPYLTLHKLFGDRTVIFCLGNHEFAYRTHGRILSKYESLYKPQTFDIHCLDIIGSFVIDDLNFFGNALWYDGSLRTKPSQRLEEMNRETWLDNSIIGFNPRVECAKCKSQIEDNFNPEKRNILLTHTVPHHELNLWMENTMSSYNMFSGCSDFLLMVQPLISVCGHTHRRICKTINGIDCINVGNDYRQPWSYFVLEV